jgi:hypothetical protein
MLKKDIYPHHMGSKGYIAKISKWKKKIEEVVSADNPNPVEDIKERSVNWLLTRSELTQNGKLVHKKKGVATVQKRQYNSLKRKDRVSSSLTGRITFLVELSAMLNTLDAFVVSLLRCRGKLVF